MSNFLKIAKKNDGFSGCLAALLILLALFIILVGVVYFQWSNIRELASDRINELIEIADSFDGFENIQQLQEILPEDIEDIEELTEEDLKELQEADELDLEGIDLKEMDLEEIDLERLSEISTFVIRVYEMIPPNIRETLFNGNNSIFDEKEEREAGVAELERDFLPNSIPVHPAFRLKNYQKYEDIPESFFEEIENEVNERYFTSKSVVLYYDTDFPERSTTELKSMEELAALDFEEDEIPESFIEENRDNLEKLYNFKEVGDWYQTNLLENNWRVVQETEEGLQMFIEREAGIDYYIMFEHEYDGYFFIGGPDSVFYTPKENEL